MREIKFRGKASHSGEWLFGYLINICGNYHILGKDDMREDGHHVAQDSDRPTWVDIETVGQYTGLYDKNGKEIYEGDVLREPPKNEYEKENYVAYEVFWHDNDCASHHIGWQMNRCHFQGCICGTMYIPEFLPKTASRMEIIGNVFDNSDLIKKGGQQ